MLRALLATATTTPTPASSQAGDASEGAESVGGALDAAITEVQDLLEGLGAALPRILIGLVVLVLFWGLGRLLKRGLGPRLTAINGESVGQMVTSIINGFVLVLGVLVFLAVAFPGVNVATLLGAGGVVALAAGFAFQDLLANMMAGILLLLRQPFEEGDTIDVDGAVGVVEAVTIRETRIRRFDRQVVVVPNGQVYANAIVIQTSEPAIRSSVIVGVGYGDDLELAERTAIEALGTVEGVLADPAPEAFYTELAGSSINLDLRYFHAPQQHELRRVQGEVVKAVKAAFDTADINIPFPIVTLDSMDDVSEAMRAVRQRESQG